MPPTVSSPPYLGGPPALASPVIFADQSTYAVSAVGQANLRYNNSVTSLQVSVNGGPYTSIPSTASITLQQAYTGGASIATSLANGAVTIASTVADNANVLSVSKNPAGPQAGAGIAVSMGANASGNAISVTNASSNNGVVATTVGGVAFYGTNSGNSITVYGENTGTDGSSVAQFFKNPGAAAAGSALLLNMGANTTGAAMAITQSGSGNAITVGGDVGFTRASAGVINLTDGSTGLGTLRAQAVGLYDLGNLTMASSGGLRWTASSLGTGAADLGAVRAAAGVLRITDGSSGNGTIRVGDGTRAAPAFSFTDDTATGICRVGTGSGEWVGGGNGPYFAVHPMATAPTALATLAVYSKDNGSGTPIGGTILHAAPSSYSSGAFYRASHGYVISDGNMEGLVVATAGHIDRYLYFGADNVVLEKIHSSGTHTLGAEVALGWSSTSIGSGMFGSITADVGLRRDASGVLALSNGSSGYGRLAFAASVHDLAGAGSPEGAVTANAGSVYRDTTGGALYVKASGTGNTGWVAIPTSATTPTWAQVLAAGNSTGGTDALVTSGDGITFNGATARANAIAFGEPDANGASGHQLLGPSTATFSIKGGFAGSTGQGVTLSGAVGSGGSGVGGNVTLSGGAGNTGTTTGLGASLSVQAGLVAGAGGGITFSGGNAQASGTGAGGALSFVAGNGVGAAGGAISGTAGSSTTTTGGNVTWTAGAGGGAGTGGTASLVGGAGGATGAGGACVIQSGAGGATSGNSGAITLQVGTVTSGNAGALSILGAAGVGSNNVGTTITVTAGQSVGSGTGGAVAITAGRSAAFGGTGTGGAVTITSGAGGGTSGASGAVTIATGSVTSGGSGAITLAPGAAVGTNQTGGALSLRAGLGTGTGSSNVVVQTGLSLASGTTAHTLADRIVIPGKRVFPADNTETTIFTFAIATADTVGSASVFYTVWVTTDAGTQVESGWFTVVAVNNNGTLAVDATPTKYGNEQALSSGTLTVTPAVTTSGTTVNVRLTSDSDLDPGDGQTTVAYQVFCNTNITITPQ